MRVSEAMTRQVSLADPAQTIREVAKVMADVDTGFVPVGENDKLVGTVTDRDIAVRAVAAGMGPDTPVRYVMTKKIKYCFDDDEIEDVARNMAENKVRRLPVVSREKRLVGVIALGDIAQAEKSAGAEAISGASKPGGPHSQTKGS